MKKQLSMELSNVIRKATKHLSFSPIFEDAYGEESGSYDEVTFFETQAKTPLFGRTVLYSEEFYDLTMDGDVDFSNEVFLTDKGNLIKFFTIRESRFCSSCQQTHSRLHRIVARDQSLDCKQLDAIKNNITVDLKHESSLTNISSI